MKRSLTAPVSPDALARLLAKRARSPRALATPFRPGPSRAGVALSHARGPLSPYVIHLDAPPCLEEGLCEVPRLNLLHASPLDLPTPPDDRSLHLSEDDVLSQLAEDLLRARATSFARAPRVAPAPAPVRMLPEAGFALEAFVPPAMPEDIAGYLVLPEPDEAPEEDVDEEIVLEEAALAIRELCEPPAAAPAGAPRVRALSWRAAVSFAALALAVVAPLAALGVFRTAEGDAGAAQAAGLEALAHLTDATRAALSQDPAGAQASFAAAGARFSQAQDAIRGMGGVVRALSAALPGTSAADAEALAEAGTELAVAGERVADGFVALAGQVDPTPTSRLALLATYFRSALPRLAAAAAALARVDAAAAPEEHRDALMQARERLPALVSGLEETLRFADTALTALGDRGTKRYLLVFQNNAELRGAGGFMGSFAEVEVSHGRITSLHVPPGGTYDLQGSLTSFVAAPEPLRLLSARWEFQDANWSPDFPTAARQILEFYGKAGGATVDGVVAVNASLLPDLLTELGSVELPAYGRVMDAGNVLAETQRIVELEYDREENAPKAVIGDLARALLDRSAELPAHAFPAIADRIAQALTERDVQLYFADQELERQVRELGWGGEVKWTEGDSLMVVHSNLGGGKTDAVMDEKVGLVVSIAPDGTVTNTATVTRTHFGEPGALFTGVNNVDYLRLYVPKGSTLLSASGFAPPDPGLFEPADPSWTVDDDMLYEEQSATLHGPSGARVSEEAGKTVFGGWMQTKPGKSSTATFTYRLPFRVPPAREDEGILGTLKDWLGSPALARYTLLLQKQSGVVSRTTEVRVDVPPGLREIWASHDLSGTVVDGRTDAFLSALFEPVE